MALWLVVRRWDGRLSWLESMDVSARPAPSINAHGIAGAAVYWLEESEKDPLDPPVDAFVRDQADRYTTHGLDRP